MWDLSYLKINRFLGMRETIINFNRLNYPVLIIGHNKDLGRSNGAGKTTIFNAIFFALAGKTLMKVPVSLYQEVDLELMLTNANEELRITRSRIGGNQKLSFFLNNKEIIGNTPTQTQQMLLDALGVPPYISENEFAQDFATLTYLSKNTIDILASSIYTPADRMKIIARMFDLNRWDIGYENAKKRLNEIRTNIQSIESSINIINEQLQDFSEKEAKKELTKLKQESDNLQKEIEEEQKQLEILEQNQRNYEQILQKLEYIAQQITNIRYNYRNGIESLLWESNKQNKIITEAEDWLKKYDNIDLATINTELLFVESSINNLIKKRDELTTEKIKLETCLQQYQEEFESIKKDITQFQECPVCKSPLMVVEGQIKPFERKTLETRKENVRGIYMANLDKYKKLKAKIEEVNDKLKEFKDKQQNHLNNRDKAKEAEIRRKSIEVSMRELKEYSKKIDTRKKEHQDEINKLNLEREKLQQEESKLKPEENQTEHIQNIKTKIQQNLKRITENSKRMGIIEEKLDYFRKNTISLEEKKNKFKELKHQEQQTQFWVNGFKEIKIDLIESFIPYLTKITNEKIKQCEMDFQIQLSTEKELQSGDIKQEFHIKILDDYGKERPIESFSVGERRTLVICLSIAINEYRKMMSTIPFNFILCDEILDGLDDVGQIATSKLINQSSGQFLVISHSDTLKDLFSSVLTAIKSKGIITIE